MMKKVLVIEGDSDVRELMHYLLKDAGYQIITTFSETDMIKVIQKENPDAIILDVIHPHKDAELCKAIKATSDINHIPLIVVSTYSKSDILKDICADDVIPKPFDIRDFITILERQLVA